MVVNKTILILEDDFRTLSKILEKLAKLEDDQPYSFSTIILTDYVMVEEFINKNPTVKVDIVLLDRDCKLGGSFHVLDVERFGVDKVIAISSVPDYNKALVKRGVKKVVQKDYAKLDEFSDEVARLVEDFVRPNWLQKIIQRNRK